jgi:TonB family protein
MKTFIVISTIVIVVIAALFVLSLGCSKRQPTSLAHAEGPCPGQGDFVPVDTIAELTHNEVPQYPRLAYMAGLEGTVWIKGLIGSGGSVLDAIIYKTSGFTAFDEAALQAAYRCEFNPAYMDDQAVCMWVTWKVDFTLEHR